jgi:hypothetical protein
VGVVLIAGYGAGCGPAASGAEGISCAVDSDCYSGLKCLPYFVTATADGGCVSIGDECLQPCQVDSDCASGVSAGLGLMCQTICGTMPACEVVVYPEGGTDAGTDASVDVADASVDVADASVDATGAGTSNDASDATLE